MEKTMYQNLKEEEEEEGLKERVSEFPMCFDPEDYRQAEARFDKIRAEIEAGKPQFHGPKEKEGKPDWSVFPFEEAQFVLAVFEYGAKKYCEPFTYRDLVPPDDLFAATIRHLVEIQEGQSVDRESMCFHWAHIAANALMSLSHYRKVKN